MKIKSVLITELHPKATEQDVLDMFLFCGPVERIEILKSKPSTPADGIPYSSAIIQYHDATAAQTALLMSRAIILGKAVQVAEYQEPQPQLPPKPENEPETPAPPPTPATTPPDSTFTRRPSSHQLTTPAATILSTAAATATATAKPSSRPSTPTFGSLFSSSNPSSAPLFNLFSSSPPKPPIVEMEMGPMTSQRASTPIPITPSPIPYTPPTSSTPPLLNRFSSSPTKPSIEPPRSAPIPIAAKPLEKSSSFHSSSFSSSHSSITSISPMATPSPQSTPPIAILDKNGTSKNKSTADDLEEMLHISEKVDTVTALATEIAHKATIEAKQFDEKYSITSKFNFLKAKALSFKQEVSEKMQQQ